MTHERNKVSFFWVLVVFIISISMAYAQTVMAKSVVQYNQELELEKKQRDLDFPVLKHWPAGHGENAVWVDPRQPVSPVPIGMTGTRFATPNYKVHLNASQPVTTMTHHRRLYRSTAKIELLSW